MPDIRGARLHSAQQARFEGAEHISPTTLDRRAPAAAKIIVVGAVGVGKTSIVRRFACDRFCPNYVTTVGVHIVARELIISGGLADGAARRLRFVVWDTDGDLGQAIFDTPYMAGAAAAIGVADATQPGTLDVMWSLLETFELRWPRRPTCAILTKCDLSPATPPQTLHDRDARLQRVCAATGQGVHKVFLDLAGAIATVGDAA